eukprot:scaffold187207_cov22-Tisochrysis_lutea.AAC.1
MTLAKRTLLNTQKHHQTAGRERGANRSAVSKLTVATTCPVARAPKDCVPTITPSPTKVIPLRSCNTAPIIEGTTAARCTSTNGEKTLSNGSANSCAHPRAAPKMRPQVIRREAAARALATPPPLRFSSAGIMMDATVERAKSTTPPSCHSWAVMACAAAAVPVWSRLCTVERDRADLHSTTRRGEAGERRAGGDPADGLPAHEAALQEQRKVGHCGEDLRHCRGEPGPQDAHPRVEDEEGVEDHVDQIRCKGHLKRRHCIHHAAARGEANEADCLSDDARNAAECVGQRKGQRHRVAER